MNKYNETTKFLRKTVISTTLNSLAFSGRQKKAMLCLNEKPRIFVKQKLSKEHHNDYKKQQQKTKTKYSEKKCEKKVSKPFEQ